MTYLFKESPAFSTVCLYEQWIARRIRNVSLLYSRHSSHPTPVAIFTSGRSNDNKRKQHFPGGSVLNISALECGRTFAPDNALFAHPKTCYTPSVMQALACCQVTFESSFFHRLILPPYRATTRPWIGGPSACSSTKWPPAILPSSLTNRSKSTRKSSPERWGVIMDCESELQISQSVQ